MQQVMQKDEVSEKVDTRAATFSDYFKVPQSSLKENEIIDLCVIYDLPYFIDPFLIFASPKQEYQNLHKDIIKYLTFLYNETKGKVITKGTFENLFVFKEIKQNWFGYANIGNEGRGGSRKMGRALQKNLGKIFQRFEADEVKNVVHLEEIGLLEDGIGADNISDFTTQIISDYLFTRTEAYTKKYIPKELQKEFTITKAYFDYELKRWMPKKYTLPNFKGDFVLLTPKDILVREDLLMNKKDMFANFENIPTRISNAELRSALSRYFLSKLPENLDKNGKQKEATKGDKVYAAKNTIYKNPIAIKYYMKMKEENKNAILERLEKNMLSLEKYNTSIQDAAKALVNLSNKNAKMRLIATNSLEESLNRVNFLKNVIENQDGYKIFYKDGQIIRREEDLHRYFKAVWYHSEYDVNAEVNNGRGPVDFKVSFGTDDQTIIEFKLASNTKLRNNLVKQTEIYAKANNEPHVVKVIMYFTEQEEKSLKNILEELELTKDGNIILIDARNDNKPSASNVKIENK